MKKLVIPFLLLTCIGLQSCKKEESKKEAETTLANEKPVKVECYQATYEKDIIDLKVNTLKNNKISGNMTMKVDDAAERFGEIAGEFHGDTLFVDYTFTEGANKTKTFKNPMAFLKKDSQLILGNGKMQTTMGVTYLVKDQPIDFDRVKYKFAAVECTEK